MQKLVLTWLVAGWLPAVAHSQGSYGFNPDQDQGMNTQEVMDAARRETGVTVIKTGYVLNPPPKPVPAIPMTWVRIEAGKFNMGTDNGDGDEMPVREVTVKAFQIISLHTSFCNLLEFSSRRAQGLGACLETVVS